MSRVSCTITTPHHHPVRLPLVGAPRHRAMPLALTACAWLGACTGDETAPVTEVNDSELGSKLRVPEAVSDKLPAFASELAAQTRRAQAISTST